MNGRYAAGIWIVAFSALVTATSHAQDVAGIEICTVEKTMERRTSCLQSNIDFLQKTMTKLALDQQQKLDAANRQIEALKANAVSLQRSIDELKAAQGKTPDAATNSNASAKDTTAKETTAKETTKDGTAKDGAAKEGAAKEGGK